MHQELLKSFLLYDPLTGIFTRKIDYGNCKAGDICGSKLVTKDGKTYLTVGINYKKYYLHRLAFLYMNGSFPIFEVDHDDGDGTNNRWSNLRDVPKDINGKNQRLYSSNKSGVAGVSWSKQKKKWRARININKKEKDLGFFDDPKDAAFVRNQAMKANDYHKNHGTIRAL